LPIRLKIRGDKSQAIENKDKKILAWRLLIGLQSAIALHQVASGGNQDNRTHP
jgi:hypothetical protein